MKRCRRIVASLLPLTACAWLVSGCPKDESLTYAEAKMALEEASLSTQAVELTSGTIEIATDFTIGEAVENAATQIRDFIANQLPCAEITLSGGTLSITYGANPGNCTYHGQTYSGTHTITVTRNNAGDVVVDHTWDELQNGVLSVSGTAHVTWSVAQGSRRVVHDLTWTRLLDGRTGQGTGDRTQRALPGGILEGIAVDGVRSWVGESGQWDLEINGVEMRWIDPVPQAGSYVLATPFGLSLAMTFERVDEDTIQVTITSGQSHFSFNVSKLGAISD